MLKKETYNNFSCMDHLMQIKCLKEERFLHNTKSQCLPNILHCSDLYVPTNEIRRILLWLQVPWNLLYEADQEEEGSFHDTIQVGGTHQVENLVFLVFLFALHRNTNSDLSRQLGFLLGTKGAIFFQFSLRHFLR